MDALTSYGASLRANSAKNHLAVLMSQMQMLGSFQHDEISTLCCCNEEIHQKINEIRSETADSVKRASLDADLVFRKLNFTRLLIGCEILRRKTKQTCCSGDSSLRQGDL